MKLYRYADRYSSNYYLCKCIWGNRYLMELKNIFSNYRFITYKRNIIPSNLKYFL